VGAAARATVAAVTSTVATAMPSNRVMRRMETPLS
jgi:hypothetical protein